MKLLRYISFLILISVSGMAAQQPAAKPPDHMRHRFDDPAKSAKSFDDPRRPGLPLTTSSTFES